MGEVDQNVTQRNFISPYDTIQGTTVVYVSQTGNFQLYLI